MMPRRGARALMLQGTGSHVGKTVLAAGLCRVFRDAGWRVAPFKAQNMALNAYVTRDGGEIGWAQAMQAEAAGVEPGVDMNPILLKPQTGGSQVIVHGRVWATLSARDYYARRDELWRAVVTAYRRLARRHDVIVIEGAGCPAEPNLMAVDITNMAVARLARAPVALVGDIDRGGVFASLIGCLAVLPRQDRRRVAGFLINKFRGDPELLAPALSVLTTRTRRPVFGVVPHVTALHLPEEDSVALDENPRESTPRWGTHGGEWLGTRRAGTRPVLDIAVVRLPHIANFTDFAPLAADAALQLRYARRPEELAGATLVILPGSKDTLADLRWLHASGFVDALREHAGRGGRLGGVCGGYQMLGLAVEDPEGLESGGRVPGIGCLSVTTVLGRTKITRRVRARLATGGETFEAYELHLGQTRVAEEVAPFALIFDDGSTRPDGAVSADGGVWGTYLHGLFDTPAVRSAILSDLPAATTRPARGPNAPLREDELEVPGTRETYAALRQREYDRLASVITEHVDMATLCRLLEQGR